MICISWLILHELTGNFAMTLAAFSDRLSLYQYHYRLVLYHGGNKLDKPKNMEEILEEVEMF